MGGLALLTSWACLQCGLMVYRVAAQARDLCLDLDWPATQAHDPGDWLHQLNVPDRTHVDHQTRWESVLSGLAIPTGILVLPTTIAPPGDTRGLMMPARGRTRAEDRAARISWERGINQARIAAEAAEHAARLAACNDPPPF